MRHDFISMAWRSAAIAAVVVAGSAVAFAQNDLVGRTEGKMEDALKSSDPDKGAYNKHDFNGLWARNPQAYGMPRCPECGRAFNPALLATLRPPEDERAREA